MSSLKSSILWGINAHHKGYAAYKEKYTDEIIKLAAEMGSQIYRINYNPVDEAMLAYINHVIDECKKYGMKIMLVLDNMGGTLEEINTRMEYIAKNLDGKVDYFQIFNETDIWCSLNDDGSFYNISNWTGMTQDYYNPERVAICIEKMRVAIDAFRRTAPNAKLVVNIGSRHFPMLDWYVEAGISWDIIGYDIYDLDRWSHADFFRQMEERYPGYEYMVAECNYPANSGEFTETQQADWLTEFFKQMNEIESDKLIGVIVYELMDENQFQTGDKWNGEAHFGVVKTNPDLSPGEPKEAYFALQKLLCGGEA